jgi:hypothetical protein
MLLFIVVAASWLEIVVGMLFVFAPQLPNLLLFGAKADGTAVPLSRFAGIALIALGIACLPRRTAPHSDSLPGLFVFNLAAAILFAAIAIAAMQHGILTWPAAILHAVIAVALLLQMRSKTPLTRF